MRNCALDAVVFFEGQFEGRGLFCKPENSLFSLWRTSQVGSHRLRQETLLERIFNNQRSPLAMNRHEFARRSTASESIASRSLPETAGC